MRAQSQQQCQLIETHMRAAKHALVRSGRFCGRAERRAWTSQRGLLRSGATSLRCRTTEVLQSQEKHVVANICAKKLQGHSLDRIFGEFCRKTLRRWSEIAQQLIWRVPG